MQNNTLINDLKNSKHDFLLVDDGSNDETFEYLKKSFVNQSRIRIMRLDANSGKAEAVRQGALSLDLKYYEYVCYLDADLSTSIDEFGSMIEFAKNNSYALVMGCRLQRLGAKVKRKTARHFIGRFFATIASLLLREPVYDSQCGAKVFKRDAISLVFESEFLTKWIFDLEILFRLRTRYELKSSCYEYPLLAWVNQGDSRLKISDFFKIPFELFKIYRRYR